MAAWFIPTLYYVLAVGALGVFSKLAGDRGLGWQDLIMWTGIGYVGLVIVLLIAGQTSVQFVAGSGWAVLSAALAIVSLLALYVALGTGQAGRVVPVSAAYPAVTVVAAAIFLSEALTVTRVIGVLVVIAGVVLLTAVSTAATPAEQPATPAGQPAAPGAPAPPETDAPSAAVGVNWLVPTLVWVFGLGIFGVTSKLALEHLPWQGLIFWSGVGYLVVVSVMLARGDVKLQVVPGTPWAVLAAVAAISGLVVLYIALTHGPANEIVPISAAYPALTVVLGALFLRERISVNGVIGLVFVIGGVVLITAT